MIRPAILLCLIVTAFGNTKTFENRLDVLEQAHQLAKALPPERQVEVLAELTELGLRIKVTNLEGWIDEVDQLSLLEKTACRQAMFYARMTKVLASLDARRANERLRKAKVACPSTADAAYIVFPRLVQQCRSCTVEVLETVRHLSALGAPPFPAIAKVYADLQKEGKGDEITVLNEAIEAYENIPNPNWTADRLYLGFVDQVSDQLSPSSYERAIESAIKSMGNSSRKADGNVLVSVAKESTASVQSEQTLAIEMLYRVSRRNSQLQEKVRQKWPRVGQNNQEANIVAGVMGNRNATLRRGTALWLEISRANVELGDSISLEELAKAPLPVQVKSALIAIRASAPNVERSTAISYLSAAEKLMRTVADPRERLQIASYIADAAGKTQNREVSSRMLALALEDAPKLVAEDIKNHDPLVGNGATFQHLKKIVMVSPESWDALLQKIRNIQETETQIRLEMALIERDETDKRNSKAAEGLQKEGGIHAR